MMQGTMRAIMKTSPAPGAEMVTVPIPAIKSHEVLVKVRATAICGTDIHIYNWDPWAQGRIKVPRVFGHEFCGEVVEAGSHVSKVKIGDFVAVETHFACGDCYCCRTGRAHICQRLEIVGVDRDGCFAEYVAVPENNAWRMDPSIPVEIAAIQDPLGNAVHTCFVQELTGNTVLVIGCGPIGLSAVAIAKKAGAARVYATDVNEFRLNLARRMGADLIIDARTEKVDDVILKDTDGFGVEVILEMSGNAEAIRQGFRSLCKGGNVALLGIPSRPMELDLADSVVFREATVRGVNGRRMFDTWYKTMALLKSGLDISPVITERFPLDRFFEAMELQRSGNVGKIILYP